MTNYGFNPFLGQYMTGIARDTAQASLIDRQREFISKYGSTTNNYNYLDQLGKMKNGTIVAIFIIAVLLSIGAFVFSNNNPKIISQCLLRKIGWIFAIIAIFALGYGGMLYFFLYLPQWNTWFKTLPSEGQILLGSIKGLTSVTNIRYNNGYYNKN